MKLRSFLYLNTKLLNDYIAAIDGYIYDAETRIESRSNQKTGGIKADIKIVNGNGQLDVKSSEEIKKEVQISNSAKFDKLYNYLSQDDGVKYYEFLNDSEFSQLSRDGILDVLVTPRFSKIKELADAAKKIGELSEMFQVFSDTPLIDKKGKEAIDGLTKLGEIKTNKEISCVFNFEDNKFPIVTYLDEQYFNVSQEQFVGQVYMFCKIQRKIEKGKSIKLDEIFEEIKNIPLNREQRRNFPKNMENPEIIRDEIKGPAFTVIPIAVYQ